MMTFLNALLGRKSLLAIAAAGLLFASTAAADEKEGGEAHEEATSSHPDDTRMEQLEALLEELGGMEGDTAGPRLIMPLMSSTRGRKLFASKGCVTCHAINGVGGEDAPPLDAHSMQLFMNPFEFAARMWRGAATMILLQEEALGEQIEFNGAELADIIAFVHDEEEQHRFSEADIPPEIMPMMRHLHEAAGGGAAEHAEELGHDAEGEKEGEN